MSSRWQEVYHLFAEVKIRDDQLRALTLLLTAPPKDFFRVVKSEASEMFLVSGPPVERLE